MEHSLAAVPVQFIEFSTFASPQTAPKIAPIAKGSMTEFLMPKTASPNKPQAKLTMVRAARTTCDEEQAVRIWSSTPSSG